MGPRQLSNKGLDLKSGRAVRQDGVFTRHMASSIRLANQRRDLKLERERIDARYFEKVRADLRQACKIRRANLEVLIAPDGPGAAQPWWSSLTMMVWRPKHRVPGYWAHFRGAQHRRRGLASILLSVGVEQQTQYGVKPRPRRLSIPAPRSQ